MDLALLQSQQPMLRRHTHLQLRISVELYHAAIVQVNGGLIAYRGRIGCLIIHLGHLGLVRW